MKRTFTLLLLLGLWVNAWAQEVRIEDVRKKEYKGVKAILNKTTNQPEGYYTFYVSEKVGGGMVNFVLELYDTDLSLIKKTPITITKNSEITSSVFNGETFMFAFADVRKKKLTFATINQRGVIIEQKEIIADKRYTTDADVYPAQNGGFYVVRPIKEKKVGYKIEKVDKKLNTLWEQQIVPEKGYIAVEAIESANDRLIVTQMKGGSGRKVVGQVICFDDKSGQKIFTHDLYNGEVTGVPTAFLIDKDKNVIAGGMYFEGEKWDEVNSDGIFFLKLSPEGKVVTFETNAWKDGIQKFLKASTTGFAVGSKPKVFFEDIIEIEGGGYKIISETFRKNMVVAGRTIAIMKALAGTGHVMGYDDNDTSPMTFEVMDLMLFNFSGEGKLNGMTHIPKEHTKITLLAPFSRWGGIAVAYAVKDYGYFDYSFTTTHPVTGQPVIVSRNLEKRPFISMHMAGANNAISTKTVALDRMPGDVTDMRVGVLPGTQGRMCVYFYNKKEQTITLSLMDMNLGKIFSRNE